MPAYPLRAVVLRKTKLGETDIILTLLAADGRQVRAVAKGLRKPGSRFGARLEPYSEVDLLLHTGKSLEVITEARTVESRAGLRTDLDRSSAAAVVADLLDKISVEGQTEPRLYALSNTTLSVMEGSSVEALPKLVVAFMLKALAMHGYRPALDECAVCSAGPGDSGSFSVPGGGVLCSACAALDAGSVRIPREARAWLSLLMRSTMSQVAENDMPPAAVADCFAIVRSFVAYHLPTRLRALDFYAGMVSF